ncbi:MAG: PAS domain S-box protein [Candidatus Falkowbacteria bacterium]|nr:MAG: PAS domain S-box protein [Candidatus Falkowbacteria bacterium]
MKKSYFFSKMVLALVIFLALGLGGSYLLRDIVYKDFLGRIKLAADISLAAVNPDRVKNLVALLPGDISQNQDYLRIKSQIIKLGDSLTADGIDAIYLLSIDNGTIYFVAESTPDGEPLSVPPGKIYIKPPQEAYLAFANYQSFYTKKYSDEFGTYISMFVPMADAANGEQIGVLGVDVDYNHYQASLVKVLIIFWLIWSTAAILVSLIFLYLRNVRRRRNEFKANEQRIRAISDAISDAVVVVNDENKIIFWSKVSENIFKITRSRALGHKFSELVKPDMVLDIEAGKQLTDFEFSINRNLIGKMFEFRLKEKAGAPSEYYELSFSSADVGSERYLVGVFHNISSRMREEFELQHQKSELEKLNNLMIGRELKMIELKKELDNLKGGTGKQPAKK